MHAIIATKARPAAIPEGETLGLNKGAPPKKELSQDSSDEIIKTEETQKVKSISDIAFATSFVGKNLMSRSRLSTEGSFDGEGPPK